MSGLPLNINIQQIFLHMLNFVILAGGLYFILYKPVKAFMDKRISYYKTMSDSAAEKKAEAESIEQQYADKISAAEEEISAMRAKAAKDAEEIIKNARSDAEEEGRRILEDAHEKALKEKEGIVEDAKKDIIELVLAAEKKLLHKAEENDDK